MQNLLINLNILFFPIRDAIGVTFHGTPFRINEIILVITSFFFIFHKKRKIHDVEGNVVLLLFIHLLWVILGFLLYSDTIIVSLATKYIFRNILYLVLILSASVSSFCVSPEKIKQLCDYTVIIQLLCYLCSIFLQGFWLMGVFTPFEESSIMSIGSIHILRFRGFCSESGYTAPFLILPIYFYLNTLFDIHIKNRRMTYLYLFISYALSFLTFSTAVYIFVVLATIISFLKNINKHSLSAFAFIACVSFTIAMLVSFLSAEDFFRSFFLEKIIVFLSGGTADYSSFSGLDRAQHFTHAKQMFLDGNILNMIIGRGTGAYYYYSLRTSTGLQSDVSEAYNLYLSTLTDRGITGLGLMFYIFALIYMLRIKNDYISESIIFSMFTQVLHWYLTGNFWLYYFWFELFLLIGYRHFVKNESTNTSSNITNT